jgi:hypothetical protein
MDNVSRLWDYRRREERREVEIRLGKVVTNLFEDTAPSEILSSEMPVIKPHFVAEKDPA